MKILKTLKELTGKDYIEVGTDEQAIILKKPVEWAVGDFALTNKGFIGRVYETRWEENLTLLLEKGRFVRGKFKPNIDKHLILVNANNCNLVSESEAEQLLIERCKNK